MKKYWVMKTFKYWWGEFQSGSFIGIDEDGIERDYLSFSASELATLISDQGCKFGEYHNRVFQQFCKWMQIDDFIIIGTGQTTDFNISGIARVSGIYHFMSSNEPRHIRDIEILKVFSPGLSMKRFRRTPRLERIDEADFHEAIISIL